MEPGSLTLGGQDRGSVGVLWDRRHEELGSARGDLLGSILRNHMPLRGTQDTA